MNGFKTNGTKKREGKKKKFGIRSTDHVPRYLTELNIQSSNIPTYHIDLTIMLILLFILIMYILLLMLIMLILPGEETFYLL